jgi:hypothetical protein
MRTTTPLAAAVTLAFLAGTASSQAINIDVGMNVAHPVPTNAYGAAAGQTGTWNDVSGAAAAASPVQLVSTAGSPSPVSLSIVGGAQDFEIENPNTTGDDDGLLDDLYDAMDSTFTFTGLVDGTYDVYVYAWAPDNRTTYYSDVTVQGGSAGKQRIGGIGWTGSFVQGSGVNTPPAVPGHYHKDTVTISGGASLVVDVNVPTPLTPTSVNGFQIVPVTSTLGFCTAKTTSVCGAATISSTGVASATATSGFAISAAPTRGCRAALLLYTNQALVTGVPFGGPGDGLLCLQGMGLRRAGPIDSGGTSPAVCDGNMSIDMNAFAHGAWTSTGCTMVPGQNNPAGFLTNMGVVVYTQMWGRDSVSTGQVLSDGLGYSVGP